MMITSNWLIAHKAPFYLELIIPDAVPKAATKPDCLLRAVNR